ncbi:MAG: hypothetical protein MUP58_03420 [Candidatus Nanohaloarchaeota archaeon QJJ-9]|nr:hypothetical protein [Candidatus Nanohaloarchaeota archaeon QJJ-9]
MLNPVSEPIIEKILPALRSVVVQELDNRGYNQDEIAEMMDLTQPAVSQYLNRRRGNQIEAIRSYDDLRDKALDIASLISQSSYGEVEDAYKEFCYALIEKDDFEEIVDYDRSFFVDL